MTALSSSSSTLLITSSASTSHLSPDPLHVSKPNNGSPGLPGYVTDPTSEGPEEAKQGWGRGTEEEMESRCFGRVSPCAMCLFIPPGPILSLLITGLNVEQRAQTAQNAPLHI